MSDILEHQSQQQDFKPEEIARFLGAFVQCSRDLQEIITEMVAIISDADSTDEERQLAGDAMMEALFPGKAADALEDYRKHLRSPQAVQAAAELRTQEQVFAQRVREFMQSKNVTHETLATIVGISPLALLNILKHSLRPQQPTIVKLAAALEVAPGDLWPEFQD